MINRIVVSIILVMGLACSVSAQIGIGDTLKQSIQLLLQRNYILTEEVNALRVVNDNLTYRVALSEDEIRNCDTAKEILADGFNKISTSYEGLFNDYKKLEQRQKRSKGLFWKGAGVGVVVTLIGIIAIR